uniref:Uncharacterized protein n=1 Tax=Anopheles dirus TaxID=7168 RepID=A0A182NNZ8_9DIPT
MSRPFVALAAVAWLASVCVLASGLSETPADAPDLPAEGIAGTDDDRPNYIAFSANAFADNDLSPATASPASARAPASGRWASDGAARSLYGWGGGAGPRASRLSPELLDGLRAALAVEHEMFMPHGEQLLRTVLAEADDESDGEDDGEDEDERPRFGFGAGRNLLKRAPTGFTGMRGRRVPSGFNGVRGKKSLSLFSWNNQAARGGSNSLRDGMRGKKSFDTALDERWSRLDELNTDRLAKEYPNFLVLDPTFGPSMPMNAAPPKRVPNGFMGLRGK